MSEKKVFIGFGTRFGATEEISHRIAELLEKDGITTQVENLRKPHSKCGLSSVHFESFCAGSVVLIPGQSEDLTR